MNWILKNRLWVLGILSITQFIICGCFRAPGNSSAVSGQGQKNATFTFNYHVKQVLENEDFRITLNAISLKGVDDIELEEVKGPGEYVYRGSPYFEVNYDVFLKRGKIDRFGGVVFVDVEYPGESREDGFRETFCNSISETNRDYKGQIYKKYFKNYPTYIKLLPLRVTFELISVKGINNAEIDFYLLIPEGCMKISVLAN
ncbi:MAG: hypothetical protein ACYTHM_11235 [Planctomycetota bacterium]|jgi:hypothetical protein